MPPSYEIKKLRLKTRSFDARAHVELVVKDLLLDLSQSFQCVRKGIFVNSSNDYSSIFLCVLSERIKVPFSMLSVSRDQGVKHLWASHFTKTKAGISNLLGKDLLNVCELKSFKIKGIHYLEAVSLAHPLQPQAYSAKTPISNSWLFLQVVIFLRLKLDNQDQSLFLLVFASIIG